MTKRKKGITESHRKINDMKASQDAPQKAGPGTYWQPRIDREKRVHLAGEAILRRVERGEWDQADFLKMMDDYLERPADRALFDLD
ncbi:hypothetical protein [Paraburkholderia tropica]|uniref:hypothetical protein n=1 Tax=Paraburkholderia tropica TaxID=92647 RepID=UPI002AB64BBB|nr:hypothetical protein [Paraburkholderia tropica]